MLNQALLHRIVTMALFWIIFALAANPIPVSCSTHSLIFKYMFITPQKVPGAHQFSATTTLDGVIVDYYDSDIRVKIPKQSWNIRDDSFWAEGTKSRRLKQLWYGCNAEILRTRLRLNDTDNHILQAYHGCEAHNHANGTWEFRNAWDTYAYDGRTFISFDFATKTFIPHMEAAYQTSRKWNAADQLLKYIEWYFTTQCVKNLIETVELRERKLSKSDVTTQELLVYTIHSRTSDRATRLLCWATGLPWTSAVLHIGVHNGTSIDSKQYSVNTGVRPNGDGTFQVLVAIDADAADKTKYTCSLNTSGVIITKTWSGEANADPLWTIPVIITTSVFVVLYNCKIVIMVRKDKLE